MVNADAPFVSQMPSKRAKYSAKTPFFMHYSEICLIGSEGALYAGLINKGIKRKKLGLFKSCLGARDALLAGAL